MRRPAPTKKVNDGPSAKGGPSLWFCLAVAVMLTLGIGHLTRPAAVKKTEPLAGTATDWHSAVPHERERESFFEDPQANRFAVLARDFERESTPIMREDMIAAFLASITADEMPGWLSYLQSATPVELAQDLSHRLIRQWTDATPGKASAWIATLPPNQQSAMLDDVVIVWANNDPTNAMNWARSLPDSAVRGQALTSVASETIRSQPLMALEIALDLPSGQQRDDLIQRGAMQWASVDAASAVAWVEQIPAGDLRNQTLSSVAIVWSASEPVAAANLALKNLPPGRSLDDTVISIVQRWAQREPEAAMAWVEQFPVGPLRETAVENLLALSRNDSIETTDGRK